MVQSLFRQKDWRRNILYRRQLWMIAINTQRSFARSQGNMFILDQRSFNHWTSYWFMSRLSATYYITTDPFQETPSLTSTKNSTRIHWPRSVRYLGDETVCGSIESTSESALSTVYGDIDQLHNRQGNQPFLIEYFTGVLRTLKRLSETVAKNDDDDLLRSLAYWH